MIFGQYARYYDILYKGKGYEKECEFLEALFAQYCKYKPKTILDLGCGTGNHMVPLLKKMYNVTGIDASAQMLALARKKISGTFDKGNVFQGKLQSFNVGKKFDVIVSMFSVIDYLIKDKDIIKTFKNIFRHMYSKSLFIFDFWQASTVEGYYSPKRKKIFRFQGKTFQRCSRTKKNSSKKMCEVNYTCILKDENQVTTNFKEKHDLRYFSIIEMSAFLKKAGLKVLGVYPFLNINGKIRKNTWDVTIVSQKG